MYRHVTGKSVMSYFDITNNDSKQVAILLDKNDSLDMI